MHVMHVVHWSQSGIGISVVNLVRELVQTGVGVTVVLFVPDDHTVANLRKIGCEVVLPADEKKAPYSMIPMIRSMGIVPDVVHTHSIMPVLISWLTFRGRTKYVHTIHSDYPYLSSLRPVDVCKKMLHSFLLRISSSVTVGVSQRVVTVARRALDCEPVLVYNGVVGIETEPVHDETEKKDGFVVTFVGRLDRYKGVDKLIRALALVVTDIPEVVLNVIGDGSERERLIRLAKELGIEQRVNFRGWQHNVFPTLLKSDLFVCLSSFEGFCLSLVEAMLCKVPVLTTKVGISLEIIKNGENGFFVESSDPPVVALMVKQIVLHRDQAAEVGAEGYRCVKEKFGIETCARSYRRIYERVMG
ncbi:MAG: glycosyltransferase [Geobacter sp.]|nr:MAG: glycosyltransferase [Geobacter sp.]